ncbi:MAG: prepilin peptidase [Patescibacteria group bacterium]|nr:prepilin peptidase [Patescibacteria group bacterium]
MFILKTLVLFYLGASLGSFTNVLVDRGQKGRSLLGRSKCDFCGHPLLWFENIPIAGFFLVRGKCLSCKRKLSRQYPIVELALAILFVIVGFWSGFMTEPASLFAAIKTSYYLFLSFLLVAIFLWDLKYMVIPDSLVASGIVVVLAYAFWKYFHADCLLFDIHCTVASSILGGAAVSGFFYFLYFISKGKYIGGGDVKLGVFLGMIVGWQWAYLLLLFAYILGAIVAIYLLMAKKKNMRSQIPFGPFLIMSTFIVLFFGEKLLYWYRQLL